MAITKQTQPGVDSSLTEASKRIVLRKGMSYKVEYFAWDGKQGVPVTEYGELVCPTQDGYLFNCVRYCIGIHRDIIISAEKI